MIVRHWNPELDGKLTEERLRKKLESAGYHVTRYVYLPGSRFPEHVHAIDKMDAVLSGKFRMTMNGQTVTLQAGDCLAVPRNEVHSAEVIGPEPVVSLDGTRL